MNGTLTLHWKNVTDWFEAIGRRLGEAYRVSVSVAGRGGGWLYTINFYDICYELRLYQVEYCTRYVIALCEVDNELVGCHQAWGLTDRTRMPARPSWMFCVACVRVHAIGESCALSQISELVWNDTAKSDDENVAFVIEQLVDQIKCSLVAPGSN